MLVRQVAAKTAIDRWKGMEVIQASVMGRGRRQCSIERGCLEGVVELSA